LACSKSRHARTTYRDRNVLTLCDFAGNRVPSHQTAYMGEEKGGDIDVDWDQLLQATAAEAFEAITDCSRLSLGDLAQGIARTTSIEKGLLRGDSSIPEHFKDVNLGDVLNSFVPGPHDAKAQEECKHEESRSKRPRRMASVDVKHEQAPQELSVAEMVDSWVRDQTRSSNHPVRDAMNSMGGMPGVPGVRGVPAGPPVIVSGVPLGALPGIPKSQVPQLQAAPKRQRAGGRQARKADPKSANNRKSAAKSRKKRAEYTKELEERAKLLKDTNTQLRKKIVDTAKAPEAEPLSLEGKRLRKSRTLPTNFTL
jgi:hypothetical protein